MSRSLICLVALHLVSSLLIFTPLSRGQASVQGQWSVAPNPMPINPIHVALLPNGKLLVVAGSGNCPPAQSGCPTGAPYAQANSSGALLWDPSTESLAQWFSLDWDMFCNAMVLLPDGRAFINGGTTHYDPLYGSPKSSIFDPSDNSFTDVADMAHGRWYPTVLTLGDGRAMTFSGLTETGTTNKSVEFYSATSGWSAEYPALWTPDLYPRLHLLPNGKVFYSGAQPSSKLFDPTTETWTTDFAITNYSGIRTYGSSVLLPLTPANNYDPKVIIMGGGNPATNTTETIDLGVSSPQWVYGPPMSQPRIEMNAVILPNGKVLAVGGSLNDEDTSSASYNADLYDPASNTFSSAGANSFPRLYHSVALLLPDATVWVAGGNPTRGTYVPQIEIYSPSYLFNSDGTPATRPSISSAPSSISYGSTFTITTPDAANISSVVLVRNGTVTHSFGMDQREVGYDIEGSTLTVTAPPNGDIAPPGYYMLFLLNSAGVPSVAEFIQICGPPPADFLLTASPLSQSLSAGLSKTYALSVTGANGFNNAVSFAVAGLPAGANASFTPATIAGSGSSTLSVTTAASTPAGKYYLTVTATSGVLSHSLQLSLVVAAPPDFSLSISPITRSVSPGNTTTYPVTISNSNGFSGIVNFQVAGVPSGATVSFSPASITKAGSSTLSVKPSSSTPLGTYQLTVIATSGALSHSLPVSLVVAAAPNFSLAISPNTRSAMPGKATTYSVQITNLNGFSGIVSLQVGGLPTGATMSFSPTSITRAGSSTLSVKPSISTPLGVYHFTITASSGKLSHTATATLNVETFSLTASPSLRVVSRGLKTSYIFAAKASFSSAVTFSLSGLPAFCTATFTPTSVAGTGKTTLTIATKSTTPVGIFTLSISAVGGGLKLTTKVTMQTK